MNIRPLLTVIFFLIISIQINAQSESILSKLTFETDFRFRIEQDWKSKKSDGSFRDDRTRLRYRLRAGATFKNDWYTFGFRIRTGDQNKQQDPQLTLGKGFEEFGTLPLGFEKVFFQGIHNNFKFWLGKNAFSFSKNNELFWSDNVFPEGVFIEHSFNLNSKTLEKITVKGGHYILSSNGGSILDDAYLQGVQASIHSGNKWLTLFPSLYILRNIANIPDGNHSYNLDYTILHIGGKFKPIKSKNVLLDCDMYHNLEDYELNSNIADELADEKSGYSVGLQYGTLNSVKDWKFKITYTSMQKYAALDYMAQNDWARWDYSSFDSPDGRLTNFKGVEMVVGYKLHEKINIIAKYYNVNQLIPTGLFAETGQRIRFDLNVKM